MKNRVHFSSATDNYRTPVDVYRKLDDEFHFTFDPCPLSDLLLFDGLNMSWGGVNFVNPPYSNIAAWCRKSYEESLTGKTVVMLIPSRTDTRYWHDFVMKATEIRFIKGRLRFGASKFNAPFPSAIVVFRGDQ